MLTQLMPALARSLSGTMSDQQVRSLMQSLGNCNQPLEHRGEVSFTPQMPRSTGGGTYNSEYWNWSDFGDIVNLGDNINNFGGDSFTHFGGNNTYNNITNRNTYNNTSNSFNEYSTFNYNYGGDTFNDFSDRRTIRLGDVFNRAGDTIINIVNNPPGLPGRDGRDGRDGADGSRGDRGEAGAPGERGRDGISIVGPAGPAGADGRDGRDGLPGPAGPPGVTTVIYVRDPGDTRSKEIKFVKSIVPSYALVKYVAGGEVNVSCAEDGSISASFRPFYGEVNVVANVEAVPGSATVLTP